MAADQSSKKTVVVATYPSRRDAEIAQDRLEGENIRAFTTADDAGGMHPELQWAQGVKLMVLSDEAQDARRALEDLKMLPGAGNGDARHEGGGQESQAEDLTSSVSGPVRITAWGYIILFVLVAVAIVVGLLLSAGG